MANQITSLHPARAGARQAAAVRRDDAVLEVTVVLLEAGYPSTAILPIEIFHSAGLLWDWLHGEAQRPRFRVRIASVDGGGVNSICKLGLSPELAIGEVEHTDVIILSAPGWDVLDEIAKNSPLLPWLRKWHARGTFIAGICTGVAFLAEAGLLDGREATTHWAMADTFRQRYPKIRWRPDQFVTEDGNVFCSGGVYAAADLSLYLVERLCGREIALQCAKSLLLSMPRSRQSGYAALPLSRPHADEKIRQAEEYLQQHFSRAISVGGLAVQTGMSPRNFIRRFKAATGRLPGAYIQALRVAAAKELFEQGVTSVQTVCARTGYEDVAFFRNLFKRHTGMTPAEYRQRFAQISFERGALVGGKSAA